MPSVEKTFQAIAHEALVVLVCLLALFGSRHLLGRKKRQKKLEKVKFASAPPPKLPKVPAPAASVSRMPASPPGKLQCTASTTPFGNDLDVHASKPLIRAVESQILQLLSKREFTRALNMYRSCERDGRVKFFVSESFFQEFIQNAIRVGKADVAERMIQTMKQNGVQPSLDFWQTILKMLSTRKHFGSVVAAYVIYDKCLPADKVTYSCLINAALECQEASLAAQMLGHFGEAGLEARDHVLYFRTYAAMPDADAAEALLRRLAGDGATTLMLNLTLLALIRSDLSERAAALVRDLVAEKTGLVDVVSYNTLIKGFAQTGEVKSCFRCLREMRAHGTKPDEVTLSSLVDLCAGEGPAPDLAELMVDSEVGLDCTMCAFFIRSLVRAGCLPRALNVYEGWRRHCQDTGLDSALELSTYASLIKGCVELHDLERALRLVGELREAGREPDDVVLSHLLEGCRHLGKYRLGMGLFSELVAGGVKPSEYTLVTLLKLCGRCGEHGEALQLVQGWERAHGTRPSVIHYTCIMSGCLRTKSYDQAWAAYELMGANDTEPDKTTLSTLLPAVAAAQQWERVLVLARRALEGRAKIPVPAEILNNALRQMQVAGDAGDQAAQLEAVMRGAAVPIATSRASRHTVPQ